MDPKGRKPSIHLKSVRLNWACPSCDFIDDKLGEVFRRSALERDARDTELVHPAGVSIAWLVASLSFLTISLGAPFGRKKAFQVTTSKSVSPCSCAVGKSGISGERPRDIGARKIFDRTSLNLAIWLPLSEQAGGEPAIWPNSRPIPVPGVEHLGGAQPKAA